MKPRLVLINHIWHCRAPWTRTGLGYTPAHAYSDWYGANRKVTLV